MGTRADARKRHAGSEALYVDRDGYGDLTIWLDTDTDGERDEVVMVRTGANAAGFDALAGLVEGAKPAETWDEGYKKGNLDGYFGTRDEWEQNPHGTAHRDDA